MTHAHNNEVCGFCSEAAIQQPRGWSIMCTAYAVTTTAAAHLVLVRTLAEVVIGQVIAGSPVLAWSCVLTVINISLALPAHKA